MKKPFSKPTVFKWLLILLTQAFLTPQTLRAQEIDLTDGLVAYYPFNGNTNDESGKDNHVVDQTGNVTLTIGVTGDENGAYHFDGGKMHVSNSESLQFLEACSFTAYVHPTDYGPYAHTIIAKSYDQVGLTLLEYTINKDSIFSNFGYNVSKNPKMGEFLGIREPVGLHGDYLNKWIHIAHVVEKDKAKFYLNGILLYEQDVITPDVFTTINQEDMYIGMNKVNYYGMRGDLDEVRIYNRALSEAEVEVLAQYADVQVKEELLAGTVNDTVYTLYREFFPEADLRLSSDGSKSSRSHVTLELTAGETTHSYLVDNDIYHHEGEVPCMLVNLNTHQMRIFFNSKDDSNEDTSDGYCYVSSMEKIQFTKEKVFTSENWGWYSYFTGPFTICHFNASDNRAMTSTLSESNMYTAIDGNVSGEEGSLMACDGDVNTKLGSSSLPAWVVIEVSEPACLTGYTIITANDNLIRTGRNPRDWRLEGSNDMENWTIITEVTNDNTLEDVNFTPYDFDIDETTEAYKYFRFTVFASRGASFMQFSEIHLKGQGAITHEELHVQGQDVWENIEGELISAEQFKEESLSHEKFFVIEGVQDPEPYAVLSDNNTVLTFYYDTKKKEREGMSVGPFNDTVERGWDSQCESISSVIFDESFVNCSSIISTAFWFTSFDSVSVFTGLEYLKTDNVIDMDAMFYGCSSLTDLDLRCFKTENVTNMHSMFENCSSLVNLEVSSFDTSKVTNYLEMFKYCSCLSILDLSNFNTSSARYLSGMFEGCSNLKTIYVKCNWDITNVTESEDMFDECISLVGGSGTVFNENHIDYTYAHIDEGAAKPGYFTAKDNLLKDSLQKDLDQLKDETEDLMQRLYVIQASLTVYEDSITLLRARQDTLTAMLACFSFDTPATNIRYKAELANDEAITEEIADEYTELLSNTEGLNDSIHWVEQRLEVLNEQILQVVTKEQSEELNLQIQELQEYSDRIRMSIMVYVVQGETLKNLIEEQDARLTGLKAEVVANVEGMTPQYALTLEQLSHLSGYPKLRLLDLSGATIEGNALPDGVFSNLGLVYAALPASITSVGSSLFNGCKNLGAVVWNNPTEVTENVFSGISNPNLLLYVEDYSQAVRSGVRNVVSGGLAQRITLTDNIGEDGTRGPSGFYVPQAFRVQNDISYTHTYTQQTVKGECRGWETIALPFDVQTVTHAVNGEAVPFAAYTVGKRPFWLCRLTEAGFEDADSIKANTPYIISMPNSEQYSPYYRLNGKVTFAARGVTVPATDLHPSSRAGASFIPTFERVAASPSVFVLNVGEERWGYAEGSLFDRDYRDVHPFEAYRTTATVGVLYMAIGDELRGATSIEKLTIEHNDILYDLSGRRFIGRPVEKGVYISNGKKVLVK